jgi:hypothetical protein
MRQPNDLYRTPHGVIDVWAQRLSEVHRYDIADWATVYDLGAGDGRIGEQVSKRLGAESVLIELDNGWDFLSDPPTTRNTAEYSIAVSNPPFSKAQEFLELALERFNVVSFLLPVSFLGSLKRAHMWNSNPLSYFYGLTPRPSFLEGGKTANAEYAIFNWGGRKPDQLYSVEVWK